MDRQRAVSLRPCRVSLRPLLRGLVCARACLREGLFERGQGTRAVFELQRGLVGRLLGFQPACDQGILGKFFGEGALYERKLVFEQCGGPVLRGQCALERLLGLITGLPCALCGSLCVLRLL